MEVHVKENGESECHFVTKWIEFVTLIRVKTSRLPFGSLVTETLLPLKVGKQMITVNL
ncbi:hypothetical protein WwAna0538 [Wolbachia endosymbiont of Drosophila ananassae]|nr:hypothetical protein WwAna0538 [Wolbachia endosymbiont of Drosophila ananassae]